MRFVPLILLLATTLSAQTPAEVQNVLAPIAKASGSSLMAAVARTDGEIVSATTGKVKITIPYASVKAPIAATVLGTLVDQGFITWETTIANVFPEWRATMRPEYAKLTLAQLLMQEGRIPELPKPPALEAKSEERRAFVQQLLTLEPLPNVKNVPPSRGGEIVAEAIAERITGQSWPELVRERIFNVFQMTSAPNLTPEDLARFARSHLVALHGRDTIVKAATARVMHSPRGQMALGWSIRPVPNSAGISVYANRATFIAVAPQQNLAIVVAGSGAKGEAAAGEALVALMLRYAPPPPEAGPRRPIAPPRRPPIP